MFPFFGKQGETGRISHQTLFRRPPEIVWDRFHPNPTSRKKVIRLFRNFHFSQFSQIFPKFFSGKQGKPGKWANKPCSGGYKRSFGTGSCQIRLLERKLFNFFFRNFHFSYFPEFFPSFFPGSREKPGKWASKRCSENNKRSFGTGFSQIRPLERKLFNFSKFSFFPIFPDFSQVFSGKQGETWKMSQQTLFRKQ